MQLLRVILVLLAAAAAAGQLFQERYRLSALERMPGPEARDRYEVRRRRSERGMLILTIASALVGAVALVDLLRPR